MKETVYLKNYCPSNFTINKVHLDFNIKEDFVLVTSKLHIVQIYPGHLYLNGNELELINICINDRKLEKNEYSLCDTDLIINNFPSNIFILTITTKLYPKNNTKLSGLYYSNNILCTQCEPEGFRRITFFLDRPDILSQYTVKINANKYHYPVLLSNGNLISKGNDSNDTHWVIWEDPFKKPSYLFALVAGDLTKITDKFTTCSGNKIDLQIYTEYKNRNKCAHAMQSLKKAMRWDEKNYNREYDLKIFMIVAINDFNMGAMENKGLNIFNSQYILFDSRTSVDQDRINITSIIGHEYFHNWTGNRVTCRDWFQLSLKEGLTVFREQQFSKYVQNNKTQRITDVKYLINNQFIEDNSSISHSVQPYSYQEINNFYTSTIYNKGAEIVRMLYIILGKDKFYNGMQLYFKTYDGKAVTIEDFISSMEASNLMDLNQFKLWYIQNGTPEIFVDSIYKHNEQIIYLTIKQNLSSYDNNKKPLYIPIKLAFIFHNNDQYNIDNITIQKHLIILKQKEKTFKFTNIPYKPCISLLRDFSAPVKLNFKYSNQDLLTLLQFEEDSYIKWYAAHNISLNFIFEYINTNSFTALNNLMFIYKKILVNEKLDHMLRAELLQIPSFEEVFIHIPKTDIDIVELARDSFRTILGTYLYFELEAIYLEIKNKETHYPISIGERKLKNTCLFFMMKSKEDKALELCEKQFYNANNMTDQIYSLQLLNECSISIIRNKTIDYFYNLWKMEELVINKWFALQAKSERSNTINKIKSLIKHPDFNFNNPNRVKSLIGEFINNNPRNFHMINGSGYIFLRDIIMYIDRINPQISAKLTIPFTRLHSLDSKREQLMKEQITILSKQNLSQAVQELIYKSL